MVKIYSLIEQCKQNNRKAQSELYGLFYVDLMRIARKYKTNNEDAAAIVNEAFFKVFTNIENYTSDKPFEAWVKRITINVIIDDFRKNKKHENTLKLDDYSTADFLEKNILMDDVDTLSTNEILKLIKLLDEEEKMVFNLFEIESYSHQEIAKELAVSERTSKMYLASAKKNLKTMLSKISKQ